MLLLYILSIENLFVMDPFIMETRRLVDLGKQTNLAGKELLEFVRTKQALARDERIRFREEKKRDEARIAKEAERIRQHKKEDEARIGEEAARIWRHKTEDEERIRKHEKEMCHLRIEADEGCCRRFGRMQRRGDARRRTKMNVQFQLLIESYGENVFVSKKR